MNIIVKSSNQVNLERLEKLAREACDLGKYNLGRNWQDLGLLKVYTAENGNHQSFEYRGIEVGFFNPVDFQFNKVSLERLETLLDEIETEVEEFKAKLENEDKEERRALKEAKKEALKRQLEDLESEDE